MKNTFNTWNKFDFNNDFQLKSSRKEYSIV